MTENGRRGLWGLLLIVTAGFALRVSLICYIDNYGTPPVWEYGEIAHNLVAGNGYQYQAYRSWIPPLYPFLLAGAMRAFGQNAFLALEVIQAGLSAVTALLLYWLGNRLFGRPTGFIALALMLLYPPLAVKTAYVDPITVEIFLLVLAFMFLYRSENAPSALNSGLTGALLGLVALSRPVLLIFVVLLSCLWVLLRTGQRRELGVMLVAFGLCLLPWTLRNYAVHREFVLVSSNGGFNFWIGNNPFSTGDAYTPDGVPIWAKMPLELKARLAGLSEVEQDRMLYKEGMGFILQEPATFLRLTLNRIGYFWWFRPLAGKGDLTVPAVWSLGYYISYALLLAAGIGGVAISGRRWRDLFPFYALFLSLTSVYAIFFVHTRYRMILEPFLIVFASFWLLSFANTLKRKFRAFRGSAEVMGKG
jgi:4-amino-4-deoxy-L-arabinose transferase-like glycosyltransferase